jgi:hypothetical protein
VHWWDRVNLWVGIAALVVTVAALGYAVWTNILSKYERQIMHSFLKGSKPAFGVAARETIIRQIDDEMASAFHPNKISNDARLLQCASMLLALNGLRNGFRQALRDRKSVMPRQHRISATQTISYRKAPIRRLTRPKTSIPHGRFPEISSRQAMCR